MINRDQTRKGSTSYVRGRNGCHECESARVRSGDGKGEHCDLARNLRFSRSWRRSSRYTVSGWAQGPSWQTRHSRPHGKSPISWGTLSTTPKLLPSSAIWCWEREELCRRADTYKASNLAHMVHRLPTTSERKKLVSKWNILARCLARSSANEEIICSALQSATYEEVRAGGGRDWHALLTSDQLR